MALSRGVERKREGATYGNKYWQLGGSDCETGAKPCWGAKAVIISLPVFTAGCLPSEKKVI